MNITLNNTMNKPTSKCIIPKKLRKVSHIYEENQVTKICLFFRQPNSDENVIQQSKQLTNITKIGKKCIYFLTNMM